MNDVMPTANGSSLHRRKTCYGILFLPSLIRLGLQSWTTVWNQPLLGIYVGLLLFFFEGGGRPIIITFFFFAGGAGNDYDFK